MQRLTRLLVAMAAFAFFPSLVATPSLEAQDPLGQPVGAEQDAAQEDYEWDVDESLGPSKVVRTEVSEGTWLNLDLSPDGGTVVFDMLGDLYTMPVTGGRATRLTSGAAFDFHPRFSPDGASIAFISDRDGAQNIWLMDPDGSNVRQVTRETNREVNSPAWSPDGEHLFVRKHFVEARSLGGGEVWMYHRSGGGGLQVTERVSWQKDQGEPALSPDGRYLYYSQDVTPGEQFEYNKDPYAGIYAIFRRDLETGDTERVTGGPGGAITPRLSPGGRLMSFIKRDRLSTVLYVRDLETGQEWPVWDGLERDMQEAWAIHGVYTTYDWTPAGDAVVVWAQGGFWRVPVPASPGTAAAEPTRIPFTAEVEQRVHEGLRYAVDVAPDAWRARMLRNVATSPDGGVVAYDALGKIWIVQGDRAPRRLTNSGEDVHELAPAFSPDGRRIAYATWSDEEGGRVRVIGVNGRGGREVVTERGHYTEPSWSPDGDRIVYRKVGGDRIRGQAFGERTGIYVAAANGRGEPSLVRDNGFDPAFDHTGERIYARLWGGRLVSTDLSGGDEITHFEGENVTDIAVSPDGEWVAFAERYRAYVARFPRTGRTVTLTGNARGYPVAEISRDAGMYLHWSRAPGTGDRASGGADWAVNWTLGPEYFSTDLASTFDWFGAGSAGAPPAERSEAAPPAPQATGRDISFTVTTPKPSGVIALTNARIITMAGEGWTPPGGWEPASSSYRPLDGAAGDVPAVIEDGTLIVRGDRIEAVGRTGEVTIPRGATVIDATGRTIMPGLIDVHGHVGGEGSGILAQTSWPLLANLAFGVTTSHDPSNNTETVFSNIELIRAGRKLGPRLFSTGTILYGAETPSKAVVESYEDALSHLRRMKAVGAVSVKSYNQRQRNARQWIVRAARELDMMVVPEGGSLYFNNVSMILDGHTGVEHSIPVPNVYDDIETLWGASSTGYTPTAIVGYGGLSGEFYFYQHYDVWANEHLLRFTPREVVDARSRRRLMAAGEEDFNHVLIMRGARELYDDGALVHLGAHGQLEGLGAHWELWMFEQGGMSPIQALAAGTIMGAQYLGMDRHIGSLEPGKLADLVVLTANPLDDIRNSDDIAQVMLGGRLYDAMTLRQLAPEDRPAPVVPWVR